LCYDLSSALCSTIFLLMSRPHPRSTLFPYTTLFRSLQAIARWVHFAGFALTFGVVAYRLLVRRREGFGRLVTAGVGLLILAEPQDRKSTRLNSSHVSISYAVFCLKKKM